MSHARFLVYSGHSAGVAAGGRSWFRWRMVSANNRALGQSAMLFDDLQACRASMAAATELTGAEELRMVADLRTGLWTWELVGRQAQPEILAVSARAYQRQRECRQSATAFCEAAPMGSVRAEILIVPSGQGGASGRSSAPRRGISLTLGT